MKAGQLAKILQSVDPETEFTFSIGLNKDFRLDLVKRSETPLDLMTGLNLYEVEIADLSSSLFIEFILLPSWNDESQNESVK